MTPAERLELTEVLARLASFLRRLATTGDRGLTTLSTLATLAWQGECRLTELAAREGLTQPAMTQLVSRLARQGLVERQPDRDRRVVNVRITAAGQRLLGERRDEWARRVSDLLGRLPADEQAAIAAALPAFRRFLAHQPAGEGTAAD
jgi:DNA-binding MarR family transcriptional regulator